MPNGTSQEVVCTIFAVEPQSTQSRSNGKKALLRVAHEGGLLVGRIGRLRLSSGWHVRCRVSAQATSQRLLLRSDDPLEIICTTTFAVLLL